MSESIGCASLSSIGVRAESASRPEIRELWRARRPPYGALSTNRTESFSREVGERPGDGERIGERRPAMSRLKSSRTAACQRAATRLREREERLLNSSTRVKLQYCKPESSPDARARGLQVVHKLKLELRETRVLFSEPIHVDYSTIQ